MATGLLETGGPGTIHDAQLDYYGQRGAVASSDNTIHIFEVADGQKTPSASLKGHEGPVWQVSWAHPKFGGTNRSSLVASSGYDMKVIIWKETSPSQWQIAHCDTSHTASVNAVQFCPWEFGLRLACASSDGHVSVLTHSQQDMQWHRTSFDAHASGAQSLSWAPAPAAGASSNPLERLATCGCDGAVKVWRMENECWSEERPALPKAHTDWVRAVAWRPDDVRVMASGGWDKTVVIWEHVSSSSPSAGRQKQDSSDGMWRQASKLTLREKVEGLSWSETGGVLAIALDDGETVIYKSDGDGAYAEVAKVSESGLQDVPNSLVSGMADAQVSGPKVHLETITPGDGRTFPKAGDNLSMHYTGKIAASGVKFDSSLDRGTPFEFVIGHGNVIEGWDQGVIQMSLGQKAFLKVPSDLGYGDEGAGGVIPPKADLIFEVELLKIN